MTRWYINARGQKRRLDDARCGTATGHSRHVKAGERPCDACAEAKRLYDADWRAQPERVLRSRIAAKAQRIALLALSRKYKAEYDAIYAAECTRLFAEHDMEYQPRTTSRQATNRTT